jgi:predicted permease
MKGRLPRIDWLGTLTLGTATGVLMAVLVLTDRLYLSPLGPARIDASVAVFAAHTDTGRPRELTSYASFAEWRERAAAVAALSGYRSAFTNIVGEPQPERLRAALVASQFFEVAGTRLARGRGFDDGDYVSPGLVCVISDSLWRRRFRADPAIVGAPIRLELSGTQTDVFMVVGVAPPGFRYPDHADIWTPFIPTASSSRNHSGQWFATIGQLRQGVTVEQARTELTRVMQDVQLTHPRVQPNHVANVVSLRDLLTEDHRTLLSGLALAAILLWLSATATVGSLLTARSIETRREEAVRVSLGAPRRALLLDALTQGVRHGAAAFLVAVPVSLITLRLFGTFSVDALESAVDLTMTVPVAAAALFVLVATYAAVLCLLLAHSLRTIEATGTRAWTADRIAGIAYVRTRAALAIVQIAFTVVAMILGAGILTRLASIERVDMGFVDDNLYTVRLELPAARYNDTQTVQFFDAALERLRLLPGMAGAAAASDEPLFGQSANPEFTLQLENRPLAPDERTPVLVNGVTRDYFALLRIPVVAGDVKALDGADLTALVNRSFAQRFYGTEEPVGRRFRFGGTNPPWWTITGVVADTRNDGPLQPPKPTVYMNGKRFSKSGVTLFAKASGDVDATTSAMRSALANLDPNLPIGRIAPVNALIRQRFSDVWLASQGLVAVSAAALALALLGLAGIQLALAAELRAEIALRAALGARPLDIAQFLGRRIVPVVLVGVSVGTVSGLATAHAVATYAAFDRPHPILVALITGAVGAVALAVSVVPVATVVRTDPALALRSQ